MRTHAEHMGAFKPFELEQLEQVKAILDTLPNSDDSQTCHSICELIAQEIPTLKHIRGWFDIGWEHSWLVTLEGNIIDPYPWACKGGPVLLVGAFGAPWHHLYIIDINYRKSFLREVLGLEDR